MNMHACMAGLVLECSEGRELAESCKLTKECKGRCEEDCPFCVCLQKTCVCSLDQNLSVDALIGG